MEKRILLIIESPTFSCELKLTPRSVERLSKSIVKIHRDFVTSYTNKRYRGNKYKKQMRYQISSRNPIEVEFIHI